ncbi:MAG TPA: sialate O-acetylesterase [Gemmataceae bacterium]|nr:sialate O-acetylesterase [Gemmataceae bacterium]
MALSRFTIPGLLLALAAPAAADVKPHALFADHMVFQRNAPLPVWGTADPGEDVYVHLEVKTPDGKREEAQSAKADKDGKWMVKLAAFPAATDGTLTIRGTEPKRGEKKGAVTVKDVAVGEVWVCSGQSNMEWSLQACPTTGGPDVAKASANPMLRLFTVPRWAVPEPKAGFKPDAKGPTASKWAPCGPDTALTFSAVAYFFGRDLQKALNVPVGLIHTSWGGTPAQAWTSTEALAADPALRYYADGLQKRLQEYDPAKVKEQHAAALEKWKAAAAKAKEDGKPAPKQPAMPQPPGLSQNDPASLYNGMISPLLPFAIKGAIWYQGESNAGKPIEYRTLYAAMIRDWRAKWGHDFPFYCIQLAPFNAGNPEGENWAYLREAQAIASARVKNAGVAVITDAGDLGDIHPQKKEPCGARLALLALAQTYGQKVEFSGPAYKSMTVDGNRAVLTFDHADGLTAGKFSMPRTKTEMVDVGGDDQLAGFSVAGEDKVFHPAKAVIEGDKVVVTSEKVAKPVAVRYGWKNFPVTNLFNKAGLPASPFRTDEFEPSVKQ